jgi:hypothetical protein
MTVVAAEPASRTKITDQSGATPDQGTAERTVIWSISLISTSPADAAIQALEAHRDPVSFATVFTVYEPDGSSMKIDVRDPDRPVTLDREPLYTSIQVGQPYRLARDLENADGNGVMARAGQLVTPIRALHCKDSPIQRWVAVVPRGSVAAEEVIIPSRAWLSAAPLD